MENPLNWAILCPGSSIKQETVFQFDPGGLIAVNHAALLRYVDWWTVLDPIVFNQCFSDCLRLSGYATIWTHSNFGQAGQTLTNPKTGAPVWDPSAIEAFRFWVNVDTFVDLSATMPFGKEILWGEYSMFASIALAVLKGAKHIRIYGADFFGKGYFIPGLENYKTKHTEKRWANERAEFNKIVRVCAENGIKVERIGYENR